MSRPIVTVSNRAFASTLALLESRFEVRAHTDNDPPSTAELRQRAANAHALLAFMPDRVDDAFLAACPQLRIVACALKGFDNFDIAACTRRGIWVTIVPDLLTEPTAELAVGLAIGLARHVPAADRIVRSGRFSGWRPTLYGKSLDGSSVAIVGAGRVGCAIARKLAGFSCEVRMTDPRPGAAVPPNAGIVAEADALDDADFVFLAVPLLPETLHMVDARWLSRLKPGALLINPARGSVVDESAVAAALANGSLTGYAADVFECEDWAREDRPAGVTSALLDMADCTLFTTHIGSAVLRVREAIEHDAALNIIEALQGMRPHGAVNEPPR